MPVTGNSTRRGRMMGKRLIIAFALAGLLGRCDWLADELGGAWTPNPGNIEDELSPAAQALVDRAFEDVPDGGLRDYHTHILGMGTNGADTWVNPKTRTWAHPIERFKALVFLSGSGVTDEREADRQYLERLKELIGNLPKGGKHFILAMDFRYDSDCRPDKENSTFYVANRRVVDLAVSGADIFVPAISVNPHRPGAVKELRKWARQGVGMVKWLPNSQGINACDERLEEYYCALKNNDMVLLTHVGDEMAVEAGGGQAFGNPLLFRYPLDLGVKVVMAHVGSLGENADLDGKDPASKAGNFDLFVRLMEEPTYQDNLFGEISATTQFNRLGFDDAARKPGSGPLLELLRRPPLHSRLVNGSDYPLPAVNTTVHLQKLIDMRMLGAGEADGLREIYAYNPLLFDYVLKRTLGDPESGQRLPVGVFTGAQAFGREWPAEGIRNRDSDKKEEITDQGRCLKPRPFDLEQARALCGRPAAAPTRLADRCAKRFPAE